MALTNWVKQRPENYSILPYASCYVQSNSLRRDATGIIELTLIVLRPKPLDTEIERRCKQAWEQAPCSECGETANQTGDDSPRVRCTNRRYIFTYTLNTPFHGRTLSPGKIVIAFALYADTLLSINQITQLFDAVYNTVHTTIQELEAAFEYGSYLVWERIHTIDGPTRMTKPLTSALTTRDRGRRRTASPTAATMKRPITLGRRALLTR